MNAAHSSSPWPELMNSLAQLSVEKVFMFSNLRAEGPSDEVRLWFVCRDKIAKPQGEQRQAHQIQVLQWANSEAVSCRLSVLKLAPLPDLGSPSFFFLTNSSKPTEVLLNKKDKWENAAICLIPPSKNKSNAPHT